MFYHSETKQKIVPGLAFNIGDIQYPNNWLNLADEQEKLSHGIYELFQTNQPVYDQNTQIVIQGAIELIDGKYTETWNIVELSPETIANNLKNLKFKLQKDITEAVQRRLDEFAQTANYDGILSACTYATSTIPKFQKEGQYCVNVRDETWHVLYSYLAEVEAGTKPLPAGYSDIEPLLPVLTWPV